MYINTCSKIDQIGNKHSIVTLGKKGLLTKKGLLLVILIDQNSIRVKALNFTLFWFCTKYNDFPSAPHLCVDLMKCIQCVPKGAFKGL